jgi:hypothetical protein
MRIARAIRFMNPVAGLNSEARLVLWVGFLDASGYLTYVVGAPEALWHSAALSIKIILLYIASKKHWDGAGKEFMYLFIPLAIMILFSSVINIENVDLLTFVKYFAVMASIFTTMCLVRKQFYIYALGYAIQGALCVVLYIAMVMSGRITDEFGRYLFFGETHPNLGAEIMVAFAVATAQSTRKIVAAPLCLAYFYAASLMQGRGAMLAICIVLALMGASLVARYRRLGVVFTIGATLILGSAAIVQGSLVDRVSDAFLLNDEYRGAGTGFAGRDLHWASALEMFTASPFWGAGIGSSSESGLQPHNFFLYGLAQLGVSVFPFFLILIVLLSRAIFRSNRNGYYIAAFALLLLFNDRFINMNIYPFFFYLNVLVHANTRIRITELSRYPTASRRAARFPNRGGLVNAQ